MPELLVEIGCEELPASFVPTALADLRQGLIERLTEASLAPTGAKAYATPRRLIVSLDGIAERQEDYSKEVRGPAAKAAYQADGAPAGPLLGFCKSQGVDPDNVRIVGDYIYVDKHIPGRSTAEIAAEALEATLRGMTFDKTMRWGSGRFRFARPLRWILLAFNGKLAPLTFEGVVAGTASRGHRFEHPKPFEAVTLGALIAGLNGRMVEPDADIRRSRILDGAISVADGTPDLPPALVEENVYLTEWPTALQGEFDPSFLSLPEPVLITVMAKHEKFFPVRDAEGKITNRFVSIRNGGQDDAVRKGNEWVIGCRFNDARFFFEEDRKRSLLDFLEATREMTYQEKLGSVRDRADRLSELAASIATKVGIDFEKARQAGLLAKADLSSGLVGELANLQGQIGGVYALRDGVHPDVAHAISTHYDPQANLPADTEAKKLGLCVTLADQLDKLAGYLGLDMAPSGSSDPYGLRRATALSLEIALNWPEAELNLGTLARQASSLCGLEDIRLVFRELLIQRLGLALTEYRPDLLAAVTEATDGVVFRPSELRKRVQEITGLAQDAAFVQTMTRCPNLIASVEKKGVEIGGRNDAALDSPEGLALAQLFDTTGTGATSLRELAGPIDAFFDSTMMMVEDHDTRQARLALVSSVADRILAYADFSRIEQS